MAAYWSFQWSKPFTTGIGGMATTDDPHLAGELDKLRRAELRPPPRLSSGMLAAQRLVHRGMIYPRTTALATSAFRLLTRKGLVVGSSSTSEFRPVIPDGFFAGMSPGQATAGIRELSRIEANLRHRRLMRHTYDELLRKAGWNVPAIPEWMDPVLVRYPVLVSDKDRAVAEAPGRLVELGTWFECPLHPIETPLEVYGYQEGMCPVAERSSRKVVNLPTHPRADRTTAVRTVRFISRIGPT